MDATLKLSVVLLKTRSQPRDVYEDYFSGTQFASRSPATEIHFDVVFVPVLEHKQNEATLASLGELLRGGQLRSKYGGMIFTSQRAVEALAQTVQKVDRDLSTNTYQERPGNFSKDVTDTAIDTRSNRSFRTDVYQTSRFPLYAVGPATAQLLGMLLEDSRTNQAISLMTELNPEILGAHAGNGANLAQYMLRHYNHLHSERWFTFYEAPRLPFIPLLGMGSENYSRKRLEADDPRLQKRPLLFLVGEQRRDVIPTTLMNDDLGKGRIDVEEVEVYSTTVMPTFRGAFDALLQRHQQSWTDTVDIMVIVVFSPQGSKEMLQAIGYLDEEGKLTEMANNQWNTTMFSTGIGSTRSSLRCGGGAMTKYIIATIGPTTRDYLKREVGFEADICAPKPSPEGVGAAVIDFLEQKGLLSAR